MLNFIMDNESSVRNLQLLIPLEEDIGKRIDIYLSEKLECSRSAAQKIIENSGVKINGKPAAKNYKIRVNDNIGVEVPALCKTDIIAQNISLDIIYEDSDVIVINKPRGLTVHPSGNNYRDTLVNALLYHCGESLSGINGVIRPGIVHRLDKDTAGLMIAAKNDKAHLSLAAQIKSHSVLRLYNAVVVGNIKDDEGTINLPLGRSNNDYMKVAVYHRADEKKKIRMAVTHYKVLGRYNYKNRNYTLLELRLETGRTHQIRVHMAHTGHPVIGDKVYGLQHVNEIFPMLNGQCLFSKTIEFIHPSFNKIMRFESEWPEYFKNIINMFEES